MLGMLGSLSGVGSGGGGPGAGYGSRMGGHFGGGAEQIDSNGGMNTRFGSQWNNSELRGMNGMGMSNGMGGGGFGGMMGGMFGSFGAG